MSLQRENNSLGFIYLFYLTYNPWTQRIGKNPCNMVKVNILKRHTVSLYKTFTDIKCLVPQNFNILPSVYFSYVRVIITNW